MNADTEDWPRTPLPWQAGAWERQVERVAAGRLPHATLLSGPAGIGKAHFQAALAARLLCESPAADMVSASVACGTCRSCGLLRAGSHPDLLRVETEADSRVIKIDQVRALVDYAAKTPSVGTHKAILLGPAELMNIASANALLKCLEEPSASTVLLLHSHQASLLPATVRSRCQLQPMSAPPREQALEWLRAEIGEDAAELLELAGGRPLAARSLPREEGALEAARAMEQGLDALLEGSISAPQFPARVAAVELEAVLARMQARLLRLVHGRAGNNGLRDCRALFALHDELARLRAAVLRGANPNRQLTIEDCAGALVDAAVISR